MGRIKTTMIRRTSLRLVEEHREKFKKDFGENKSIVRELIEVPSKKQRNIIAGYVTRLIKMNK
tara:strand:- start:197 stop:385 length:189 start_codon:yes stop_codon:yes gene_type:complete